MKTKFMQTAVGTFLGLLLLFGCTQIFVSGQENENDSLKSRNENSAPGIEGVWQTTVTQRVCGTGAVIRTFQGLLTFDESGTFAETSAVTSPALRSPGHGVWEKRNRQSYFGAFIFLRFNPDGSFAGTQKVSQNFELSRFGNTFEANGSVQVFDPNGNLIATGCATATGTRFE